jgi:hypothetical protein
MGTSLREAWESVWCGEKPHWRSEGGKSSFREQREGAGEEGNKISSLLLIATFYRFNSLFPTTHNHGSHTHLQQRERLHMCWMDLTAARMRINLHSFSLP